MISPNNKRKYIYGPALLKKQTVVSRFRSMSDYHALQMNVNVDGLLKVLPGQYHLLTIVETPFLV